MLSAAISTEFKTREAAYPASFTIMLPLLAASLVFLPSVQAQTSQVAATWYAGWHATEYPLSSVSWSKYNTVYYAFA
jgi:chitinase